MSEVLTIDNLLYEKNKDRDNEKESKLPENEIQQNQYQDILEKVIDQITKNNAKGLAEILYDSDAELRLKNLINKYLVQEKLVDQRTSLETLTNRIYDDMAGISFIRPYLDDPEVEEININGVYGTWIVYPDKKVLIDEHFSTSEDCINVIKKMARMGKLNLDGSSPTGDSFLQKGIRISAAISPVVDEKETGAIASIRKQKPAAITKENLLEYGTASADEIEFLTLCVNSGISVAIAGATGSGKTADLNYLLQTVSPDTRIYTIEDTKELQLEQYDQNGKKINDVVQLYTKEPPAPVTMDDLVRLALRFHPKIIVPAEMRGKEALQAVEAGRTGHTIVSSLHANSALDAYDRILSMYLMAETPLSEERILKMIVSAFPIVLYKMQLPDGSRKYIEIFEATGVENGNVVGHTLFKFENEETIKDDNGKIIKMKGRHLPVSSISKRLQERFHIAGVENKTIEKFATMGVDEI